MDLTPLVNAAGGLLFAALGAAILVAAPRTRTNVLFATFLVTFGSPFVLANLLDGILTDAQVEALYWAIGAIWISAGILLLAFWMQPEATGAERHRARFVLPTIVTSSYLAISYAVLLPTGAALYASSYYLWAAAFWFGLVLLALTFPTLVRQTRSAAASRLMVLSLGLAVYPAFSPGTTLHDGFFLGLKQTGLGFGPLFWLDLLLTVLVGLLWIGNSVILGGTWGRRAAGLGIAILGLGLGGMLLGVSPIDPNTLATQGIARAIGVLVLVYGVLRHQLLGIDVTLRWGLSRSTIAAAFVTVFFVASEGAQLLFGQENELAGLAAAGALVFAIAPLQRAAERLAEKAVPVVPATGSSDSLPRESSFRKAVRLALRDSALTRDEEGHLHELARDLGLDGARAHAIIAEIEREVRL